MQKYLTIISLLLLAFSITAQTINRVDYMTEPNDLETPRWSGEVIENEGKFYIHRGDMSGDFYVNDSLIREVKHGYDVLGFPIQHSIVPIYEVDKGITDHIAVEFSAETGFSVHDSLIALAGSARYLVIQDDTLYGDFINGEETIPKGYLFIGDRDYKPSLLETVLPSLSHVPLITDEGIYIAYRWFSNIHYPESIFMGESFVNESLGADILIHKISRDSLTKSWSRRISTGSRNEELYQMITDKEGNIVVVFKGVGNLYFEDSLLTENYFPEGYFDDAEADFYIVKLSPEGELIDFLIHYGYGAEVMTDITFSDNNELLVMGILASIGDVYLDDQLVTVEPDPNPDGIFYAPGYIVKYDTDWNVDWYKLYKGHNAYVTEAIFEGEDILVSYHSIFDVSDADETFDAEQNQGSFHLHRLDKDGNEISSTVSAGLKAAIVDIKKIEEDRYLILILDRPNQYDQNDFNFLNYDLSAVSDRYKLYMFDVSGDLFESVSVINEYLTANHAVVFPNPVQHGELLNISLPDYTGDSECTITVSSISGVKEYSTNTKIINGKILLSTDKLNQGNKILSIQTKNQLYTTQIIIN